jgi:hypothetical protein
MKPRHILAATFAGAAALGLAVAIPIAASAAGSSQPRVAAHIVSAWPNDVSIGGTGGYIVWSNGKVMTIDGAPFYGTFNIPTNNVVGFAENSSDNGYWVVTSTGKLYGTHGVCQSGETLQGQPVNLKPGEKVVGAVSASSMEDDFALVTNLGRTFNYGCEFTF